MGASKNGISVNKGTWKRGANRHIIGYNWCAIGIENVGGVNGVEDLTDAQLEANVELIKYLHKKYATNGLVP